MDSRAAGWVATAIVATFAVAFVAVALFSIFAGYHSAPHRIIGGASLAGNPLKFWLINTVYLALAAGCGYFAVMAAPAPRAR